MTSAATSPVRVSLERLAAYLVLSTASALIVATVAAGPVLARALGVA